MANTGGRSQVIPFAENGDAPTTLLGILGILATGVSALLGMVVKWLLSHITDMTKQSMEMSAARDKLVSEVQKEFKDSLQLVVNHCEREIIRQSTAHTARDTKLESLIERQIEATEELKDVIASLHAKILTEK